MVGWYGMHICVYALPHCNPVFAMLGCRRVEHAIRINYWWFKNVSHLISFVVRRFRWLGAC